MLSEKNKILLIKTSILAGSFIFVTALLTAMVFLAKGFWKSGLKVSVENTLSEYSEASYEVGNFVELKSQRSPGAAVFECKKKGDSGTYYAVVMRIPTLAGPAPAVFLCSEYGTDFAGFAVDNGKIQQALQPDFQEIRLQYWKDLLPELLLKAGMFDD